MQQQDHVWQLIADYLNGEASPEALQQLQQITDADPILKNIVDLLVEFWQRQPEQNSPEINDAWDKHLRRM